MNEVKAYPSYMRSVSIDITSKTLLLPLNRLNCSLRILSSSAVHLIVALRVSLAAGLGSLLSRLWRLLLLLASFILLLLFSTFLLPELSTDSVSELTCRLLLSLSLSLLSALMDEDEGEVEVAVAAAGAEDFPFRSLPLDFSVILGTSSSLPSSCSVSESLSTSLFLLFLPDFFSLRVLLFAAANDCFVIRS